MIIKELITWSMIRNLTFKVPGNMLLCIAIGDGLRSVSFNMDLTGTDTEFMHGQPQDPIRVTSGFQFNL